MQRYITEILTIIPGVIIAMSFHEFAHAFAAYKMGDQTARLAGRLTLDPVSHIDPIGFLMLLLGGFGWAKPVPINENNFSNRTFGVFLVSIAGVAMNILIATLTLIFAALTAPMLNSPEYEQVMYSIVWINIAFAAFNLLPIPPLDGSKILAAFLPTNKRYLLYQYERYGFVIMVLLIMTGALHILLDPIISGVIGFIQLIVGVVL